jgi:hypothetical protein
VRAAIEQLLCLDTSNAQRYLIDEWQMIGWSDLRSAASVVADFNFANRQAQIHRDGDMPGLMKRRTT